MKVYRFNKYWCSPKQMINRSFLSAWSLNVHTFTDLQNALDSAHALGCVSSLSILYSKGNFTGTCVVPNYVKSIYQKN